jgi:hypothetical protein
MDVLCLQETHIEVNAAAHFNIAGFDLVSYTLHAKHGRAVFVRSNITSIIRLPSTPTNSFQIGGYRIANVYKHQVCHGINSNNLPALTHSAVCISDFSFHHLEWDYWEPNADGEYMQS